MARVLVRSIRTLGGSPFMLWDRGRRDTLLLMGAVLLTMLPQFPYQPGWAIAGFLLLFLWRLGLVLSGRRCPGTVVRMLAAFACTAAVYAHYQNLVGRDPGVTLLVLFLGLKLLEMQARRDLFVVIFLCFFLLLAAFLHSQALPIAALVLVALFALIISMLTIQFAGNEAALRQRLRLGGVLFLQAIPLAVLLFIVFPRLSSPVWGARDGGTAAQTGLAPTMTPGSIAELSQSSNIAFRVRFDKEPARPLMYWRGPVLDRFDGRSWSTSPHLGHAVVAPSMVIDSAAPRYRYTVTLEPTGQHWLFALEAPVAFDERWTTRSGLDPGFTRISHDVIGERVRYSAEAVTTYRLGTGETPASLRNWLELPAGSSPRTRALAAQWRAEDDAPRTLVARALRLFAEQPFRYTVRPPLLGDEPVDDFLFATRAGFCEHYASAFVVLMRALGIPARVITGYQGGERNVLDDYWIVRQSDAHAWTEVWIAGAGWLRIDPTAAVAPERIEQGAAHLENLLAGDSGMRGVSALWHQLGLRLDGIAHGWNQWVLSYDGERQRRLFEAFGFDSRNWRDLAGLFAALSMLVVGGSALLTLHPRSPQDPVERAWSDFCGKLAASGIPREPHETAWQYHERSRRLLDPDSIVRAREIVALYNTLRYSGRSSPADVRHLRQSVARFEP